MCLSFKGESNDIEFRDYKTWCEGFLLCPSSPDGMGVHPMEGLQYSAEYQDLKDAFSLVGLIFEKVTHLFRGVASRLLYEMGVPYHQVAQLGVWETMERLVTYYLTGTSLAVVLETTSTVAFASLKATTTLVTEVNLLFPPTPYKVCPSRPYLP